MSYLSELKISQQPTANSQQPTANSQQPTANSQQPTAIRHRGTELAAVYRLLFLTLLIHHTSYIIFAPTVQAQGVYKKQYIYAHTFETGVNTGIFKSPNENCVKFVGFEGTKTSVQISKGDKDKVITVTTNDETTGTTSGDESFDTGQIARCFPFTTQEDITNKRIKLSMQFLPASNPIIKGIYFEAGHVNMDGTFVTNSKSQYRLIVKNSTGTELFNSGVLNNVTLWNKFFVPFPANLNTTTWAGQNIIFEIRSWTNSATGSQVFRFDDIALIGSTSCSAANLALGNLVWQDNNGDGTADAAEPRLGSVCMNLYADDGDGIYEPQTNASYDATKDASMGQTQTDATGKYTFSKLPAGDYFVGVCGGANFKTGGTLKGLVPTPATAVGGNTDQDNKDHSITRTSYRIQGGVSDKITLALNGEPTNDGDDANTNSTIDFGFQTITNPLSLGNLVWRDKVEDGLFVPADGETGLSGVVVHLYNDTDNNGLVGASDELIDITKTIAGNYLFSDLLPANYLVTLPSENFDLRNGQLAIYRPSLGKDPASDPDDNINNDDNGLLNGYAIVSKAVTLSNNSEPINDGDTDANSNLTVDFAFFLDPCAIESNVPLGTVVWNNVSNENTASLPSNNGTENFVTLTESYNGGQYITGGYKQDNGGLIDNTYERTLIKKVDNLGNTIWTKTLTKTNGNNAGRIVDIEPLSDGGFMVIGTANDIFQAWKLDTDGNVIWDKVFSTNVKSVTVKQTTDGGFIFGGTNNPLFAPDYWITKTDANGNIVWWKIMGGSQFDYLTSIDLTSDGGYIIGGRSNSDISGDRTASTRLGYDYWIIKLDANGNKQWDKAYGSTDADNLVSVKQTPDGGYIMGGNSISGVALDKTEPSNGYDFWIVKTNSTGTKTWDKTISWAGDEVMTDIFIDAKGGGYLVGGQLGFQEWIFKLNDVGVKIWDYYSGNNYSTTSPLYPTNTFIQTLDGNFALAGSQTIPILFSGNRDAIVSIMKLAGDPCTKGLKGSLKLGNYIFKDDANDGISYGSAPDPPIANVVVDLYVDTNKDGLFSSATDTYIKTTTTDATGLYLFSGLVPENYFVRVAPENFNGGKALNKYISSTGSTLSNDDSNNRDHGTDTQKASEFGVISSLITLAEGAEPTTDGDADANSNLTIDFGFYLPPSNLCLGNLIWKDLNNNAVFDAGEPPISGVTVQLFEDTKGNAMLDATDTKIGTDQVTDASGLYKFCSLSAGNYFVNIPASNWQGGSKPLDKLVNSTTFAGASFDIDNDDSGVEEMAGSDGYDEANQGVTSTRIILATNTEPDVAVDGDDKNGNMTVDFGFFQPVNLGDLVWKDTNNNGIKDSGENPIANVLVDLFIDNNDGILNALTDNFYNQIPTNATGNYFFDRLAAGKYFVRISAANFGTDGALVAGCASSTGNAAGNSDVNEKDHGIDATKIKEDGVVTAAIDLTVGGEPAVAIDGDNADGNLTIDFGFFTCTQPDAGADRTVPCATTKLATAAAEQTWLAVNKLPLTSVTATIDPATGAVAGMSKDSTYIFVLTVQGACTDTVKVTRSGSLAFTLGKTETTCASPTSGVINFATFPASGTYTYNYSTGASYGTPVLASNAAATSTTTITALSAGTYTVRLFDAGGCYADQSITLTAPAGCCTLPTGITSSYMQQTCSNGSPNPDGIVTLSGFTTGQRYQFSGEPTFFAGSAVPATPQPIPATGLVADAVLTHGVPTITYTVRVYDASNNTCYTDVFVAASSPNCLSSCTPLSGLTASATPASLTTGNASALAVSGTGIISGTTYTWAGTGAFTATTQNPSTGTLATAGGYTYTVTATNANGTGVCTATATTSLTVSTAAPTCTVPAFTATTVQGTCTGATTNADAKLMISGVTNGDKVAYSTGATYSGAATYSTATLISALSPAGTVVATLANPASTQQYTIRVYNTANTCYTDQTVTLNNKTCTVVCVPRCGKLTIISNP